MISMVRNTEKVGGNVNPLLLHPLTTICRDQSGPPTTEPAWSWHTGGLCGYLVNERTLAHGTYKEQQAERGVPLAQEHRYQGDLWGFQGALLLTPAPPWPSFLRLDPGLGAGRWDEGTGTISGLRRPRR